MYTLLLPNYSVKMRPLIFITGSIVILTHVALMPQRYNWFIRNTVDTQKYFCNVTVLQCVSVKLVTTQYFSGSWVSKFVSTSVRITQPRQLKTVSVYLHQINTLCQSYANNRVKVSYAQQAPYYLCSKICGKNKYNLWSRIWPLHLPLTRTNPLPPHTRKTRRKEKHGVH